MGIIATTMAVAASSEQAAISTYLFLIASLLVTLATFAVSLIGTATVLRSAFRTSRRVAASVSGAVVRRISRASAAGVPRLPPAEEHVMSRSRVSGAGISRLSSTQPLSCVCSQRVVQQSQHDPSVNAAQEHAGNRASAAKVAPAEACAVAPLPDDNDCKRTSVAWAVE